MTEEQLEQECQKMEANNGKRQEILDQIEQRHNRLNGNGRKLFGRGK